jgi:hypothetical protein
VLMNLGITCSENVVSLYIKVYLILESFLTKVFSTYEERNNFFFFCTMMHF